MPQTKLLYVLPILSLFFAFELWRYSAPPIPVELLEADIEKQENYSPA